MEPDEWDQQRARTPTERLAVLESICSDLRREWRETIRPKLHDLTTESSNLETRFDALERQSSKQSSQPQALTLNGVLLLVAVAVLGRDPDAVIKALLGLLQ